jgi:hypothetical protein
LKVKAGFVQRPLYKDIGYWEITPLSFGIVKDVVVLKLYIG